MHLKAENLQRTGSFKIRGAVNKIASLTDGGARGGRRRRERGQPRPGRRLGRARGRDRGDDLHARRTADGEGRADAQLRRAGRADRRETFEDALAAALDYVEETGATFIHPFEDLDVIAGQGTIGLELAEQVPDVETVVVPIGGGGLASGIALALRAVRPEVRIVGVQAAACAPLAGSTDLGYTIAEGIAVKHPGELTSRSSATSSRRRHRHRRGDQRGDRAAAWSARSSSSRARARRRSQRSSRAASRETGPVAAILSGGNIDPTLLIQVMRHGLTLAGRYLVVRTRVPDRPGELIKLLSLFADERANVVSVEHHREGMDTPVTETEVEADAPHARPGALRRDPRRDAAARVPGRPAATEHDLPAVWPGEPGGRTLLLTTAEPRCRRRAPARSARS